MTKRLSNEQLETELYQARIRLTYERMRADRLYTNLRRLENRVRNVIVVGEQVNTDDLYQLRILVPRKPRPTLVELRKKARR